MFSEYFLPIHLKYMIFYFQFLEIMQLKFNIMDLTSRCRRVVFEWEVFGLKFFQNDTSLSTHTCVCMCVYMCVCARARVYIYVCIYICIYVYVCVCVCIYIERETCVIPEEFEAEFFSLKYNTTISECKIHSVEIDLHYFN